MSLTNQNTCEPLSDLYEYPAMAPQKKTSGPRPVNLPREPRRPTPRCKPLCPSTTTKTVNKTVTEKSPAAPRTFATIAASAAHLPDPGATEKKISLISRPLKERKKKSKEDDYDVDPQDEWYASSSDDECQVTDNENYPSDDEMWQ
jgi:hypothetical protein